VPGTLISTRVSFVFPAFSHTVLDELQLCLCMPQGASGGSGANFKKGRRADPGVPGERESLACQIRPKFKLCTRSVPGASVTARMVASKLLNLAVV
jgi:hypothetical protein